LALPAKRWSRKVNRLTFDDLSNGADWSALQIVIVAERIGATSGIMVWHYGKGPAPRGR